MKKDVYVKKSRGLSKRNPKKILLISVEGSNKTERQYFKKFESEFYKIRFVNSDACDPKRMMNELKREYKRLGLSVNSGDLGIALVDSDFNSRKDMALKDADVIASKSKSLRQIVSSPCFEIWFLCHYECTSRGYNSQKEVLSDLRKYIKDYKKSNENLYELLKDKIDIAIKNAETLYKKCLETKQGKFHTIDFNPSTEVFNVVKLLKNGINDEW